MIRLDLTDKLARFPIAYNLQPVRGWPVKHFDTELSDSSQRTKQQALGEGPWDGVEKLWADAFEIPSGDYIFHPGMGDDLPDANFPSDAPHPWTAYISAKAQAGLTDAQTDALFGVYRTLRTPNYNGSGQQLNAAGSIVSPADPRDEYFFKPNPANCAVDQLLRWGKRLPGIVNFPAWVDWRDYNDELISRDNAAYTPRSLSLTPTSGGSLVPGTTYYFRVSTIRAADESSASQKTIETSADSILLLGGQTAAQVSWLIKGDEEDPAAPPGDITEYRVYVGTAPGAWLGYFTVADPALRTLLITTVAGVTAGNPLDVASAGLLSQIKRFECGLFFVPPYDLASALDRICQISCADWQWSGLGTSTYRNDKVRFLSPATRTPVFTLNLAETGMGSFRTYPVDRRSRPNQVIVNFRDRDDEFLAEAQPVILDREQLQIDEGQVKPFTIDGGTMYRSQAQRVASFYARVLCDMDQMAAMIGSPKSYSVLPADVVYVTNDTPGWTNQQFMVRKKEEKVETTNLGDQFTMQLYTPGLYSDTDHSPLPRPLPVRPLDPFADAPVAVNLIVTVDTEFDTSFSVDFDFTAFHLNQRARIYIKGPVPGLSDPEPDDLTYRQITTVVPNAVLEGHYQSPALPPGVYWIKVVTESALGKSAALGHPVELVDLLPQAPTSLLAVRGASGEWFSSADGHPRISELPAGFVQRITRASDGAFLRDIPISTGITQAAVFGDTFGDILVTDNNLSALPTLPFTADTGTDILTISGHRFVDDSKVRVTNTGGGLPAPLLIDTDYFIWDDGSLGTDEVKLSATLGGAPIDITTAGTGTHSIRPGPFQVVGARTSQELTGPGSFLEIEIPALDSFAGGSLNLALFESDDITWTDTSAWTAGVYTLRIVVTDVTTGEWAISFWDIGGEDAGDVLLDHLSIGTGPMKLRLTFSGTELRVYKNWDNSGTAPLVISRVPPAEHFPMKAAFYLATGAVNSNAARINRVVIGGAEEPSTIYSLAQQETDLLRVGESAPTAALGLEVGNMGVELWQTSRYPNTRGTSVSGVF